MVRKILFLVVGIVFFAGLSSANAQDWGFNPGDWEFTVQGSGTSDDSVDNSVLSSEFSIGYFFTDNVELGLRQGIGFVDIEGSDDVWNASSRGFLDYHFDLQRFQPFLGINFGYLYGDNINETWIAGPEGGIKYFMSDRAFLYALIEYNFTFEDVDEADEAFEDGRFVYALGVGFSW
ncbi:MAG: hypothetical protein M0P57_03435 [Syntrophales bacterium]|jgi:hypothetical protein|nr:hypothetical protein [Syntrophales bacterium]MDY0044252.1 hypothetical protein [Syntrophales bacterium]